MVMCMSWNLYESIVCVLVRMESTIGKVEHDADECVMHADGAFDDGVPPTNHCMSAL